MPVTAPYGSWSSPITSALIAAKTIRLGQTWLEGEAVYWTEGRPSEAGRNVLVRQSGSGPAQDLTPAPFNVRTRVHEYGGGAFVVAAGVVYFSDFADQRLYRLTPGSDPQPITAAAALRYADARFDPGRNRLIAVREDHRAAAPINALIGLSLADGEQQVLASGHDFYANPRLSPDGSRLAWLSWDHPNMPWDGTRLWVAAVAPDGSLGPDPTCVAGGDSESIFQPEWLPDGSLAFVSDRSNWWNLYLWDGEQVSPLCPLEAEFGQPQWVFGQSTYAPLDAGRILCTFRQNGADHLAILAGGELERIPLPYTSIDGLRAGADAAVFVAGSPTLAAALVRLDLATRQVEVLRQASDLQVDPGYLSLPEPVAYPSAAGRTAYGFFYPPRSRDFQAPAGELPPLLVKSHGGPTGSTSSLLSLGIQYWTSRGFAVLDVDYGGSTGYGRAYRDALKGQWGIVDVEDCVCGAQHLVAQGRVDPARMAIDGGSAGGYTTLCALTFWRVFAAGASYYGVSDLEALAQDTHKFESRYLDSLVGPYPERKDLYRARSPIHFADRLACPVIFFQGLEDAIVPPNQAELMVNALKAKGLPVAYVSFAGEQHGFRQAENIRRSLDGEFYFYSRIFGFEMADPVNPIVIENLRAQST